MITEVMNRIEGEGRVEVVVDKEGLRVNFSFREPHRFFEKILRGMSIYNAVDVVSRICGLCGVSHIYAYVKSIERDIDIPEEVEDYRRILMLLERVKSHLIHSCFLYLPDILSVDSINEMYSKYRDLTNTCLELYSYTYYLMKIFEHRLHNIVNIKLGGVYYYPERDVLVKSMSIVKKYREKLCEVISILSKYIELFSEKHLYKTLVVVSKTYPVYSDQVKYSNELIHSSVFENKLVRISRSESSGIRYCMYDREVFLTGPLVRVNTYRDVVRDIVEEYLAKHGLDRVMNNVYASILSRLVEIIYSLNQIEDFVENYRRPIHNSIDLKISSGVYSVFVEAPRGVLYHRYVVENNRILDSLIITPTQLNAYAMEKIPIYILGSSSGDLLSRVKFIIRSLDPCLSCAVHVVRVE